MKPTLLIMTNPLKTILYTILYNQSFLFHLLTMTTCLLIKMTLSHFLVILIWNTYKTLITITPLSLTVINYLCNNFSHNFLLLNTLQLLLTNLVLIITTINLTCRKLQITWLLIKMRLCYISPYTWLIRTRLLSPM